MGSGQQVVLVCMTVQKQLASCKLTAYAANSTLGGVLQITETHLPSLSVYQYLLRHTATILLLCKIVSLLMYLATCLTDIKQDIMAMYSTNS